MNKLPSRAAVYVGLVVLAGAVLLFYSLTNLVSGPHHITVVGPLNSPNSALGMLLFLVFEVVASTVVILVPEEGGERSRQSLSAAGVLAMAVTFQPTTAALIAALATIVEQVGNRAAYGRRPVYRVAFNTAEVALATGTAAYLFSGICGTARLTAPSLPNDGWLILAATLGAVASAYIVAYGLTIGAVSLTSRVSVVELFFKSHRATILPEATAGVVGVLFGYLWLVNPALCPVALLPLAVIYLAFKNFIRLQELDRLKSNFITEVSHELRTPLSAILASSELLYHEGDNLTQENVRDLSRSSYESSNHLFRLVENLLNANTLQSGTLRIRPVSVSLDELISDAVTQVQPFMESKHQSISLDLPVDLPEVLADPQHIVQVLINLLINASKYSEPETAIRIECGVDNDHVRVAVIDQGIGIPDEEQAQIFDRFYRVPSNIMTSVVGSGLGLSIVKSLVELHKGSVGVSSSPGAGSIFWFTLPPVWSHEESVSPV